MSWEHIAAVDLSEKFIIEKLVRCIFCSHGLSHGLMNFLNVHKRIHSGKRPQRCTQYNYSASQLVSLRNHISKHTGEKTHHCNQCEYSTAYFSNLKVHKRTHCGEKPPRCTVCKFSTIRFLLNADIIALQKVDHFPG